MSMQEAQTEAGINPLAIIPESTPQPRQKARAASREAAVRSTASSA